MQRNVSLDFIIAELAKLYLEKRAVEDELNDANLEIAQLKREREASIRPEQVEKGAAAGQD